MYGDESKITGLNDAAQIPEELLEDSKASRAAICAILEPYGPEMTLGDMKRVMKLHGDSVKDMDEWAWIDLQVLYQLVEQKVEGANGK